MASSLLERALRPQAVVVVLLVVVVASVLLSPPPAATDETPLLTTYSTSPNGAKAVHEIARRMGWPVERRLTSLRGTLDARAVYVLLAPPEPVTSSEAHALLDAVRRGAGLVFVADERTVLSDSLNVRRTRWRFDPLPTFASDLAAPSDSAAAPHVRHALRLPRAFRADTALVLAARDSGRARPVVAGFALGAGRVVAIADASVLRNDVVRRGLNAAIPIRALEYASPAPRSPVVFGEYHFGYGERTSLSELVWRAMTTTPAGRAALVLIVAALLLLMAASPRPIAPVDRVRIERRSPLEHVGALARAYEQIAATRSTVRRLVRGVRRRHGGSRRASEDEEGYLATLRVRHPSAAGDIALVERALHTPTAPAELRAAGDAIARIERLVSPLQSRP
jgi:hypothetical protein